MVAVLSPTTFSNSSPKRLDFDFGGMPYSMLSHYKQLTSAVLSPTPHSNSTIKMLDSDYGGMPDPM